MPIVTPDVEADFIARAVALAPSIFSTTGDATNIFAGQERRPDGDVIVQASFVRWYTERRRRHYSGQIRELLMQLLMRFDRDGWVPDRRAEAFARARAAYDALHQSGGFTGLAPTSATYLDIVAEDAPAELDPAYFAMTFAVWYPG